MRTYSSTVSPTLFHLVTSARPGPVRDPATPPPTKLIWAILCQDCSSHSWELPCIVTFHSIPKDAENAQLILANSNTAALRTATEFRSEEVNANSGSGATHLNKFGQAILNCFSGGKIIVHLLLTSWMWQALKKWTYIISKLNARNKEPILFRIASICSLHQ